MESIRSITMHGFCHLKELHYFKKNGALRMGNEWVMMAYSYVVNFYQN